MLRHTSAAVGLVIARRNPAGYLEGRAARGSGRRGAVLASFLQSDIQGDIDAARGLLAEIAAVERGEAPQPPATGNAYSIAVTPEGATIRNAVVEGSQAERYDLDELRRALGTWIAAIDRARRTPG